MKVYYIGSDLAGCYNIRCLFPLMANGFDGDRTTFQIGNKPTPENKAAAVTDADIVVFHRPEHKDKLKAMRLMKEAGKKIVFDNDDTYKDYGGFKFNNYMDEEMVKRGMTRINDNIDQFLKECDLVTCTTEFLKKEYEKINPNVIVLPNCIDPFYFPEPERNETDIIRIGITGSVGITSDIEPLKPIIDHYQHDPRVRLVMLSLPRKEDNEIYKKLYTDEYAYWESVNIEWHPLVNADKYYDTLNDLKLDMCIIPRYDNQFNRCKSNLKFLENSVLEIPTIAQAFSTGDSPYQQNPEDQKHLLLAGNTEEFIAQIEKLIADKDLRRSIGKDAREYVLANYDINDPKNYLKWRNAYQTLLNK